MNNLIKSLSFSRETKQDPYFISICIFGEEYNIIRNFFIQNNPEIEWFMITSHGDHSIVKKIYMDYFETNITQKIKNISSIEMIQKIEEIKQNINHPIIVPFLIKNKKGNILVELKV